MDVRSFVQIQQFCSDNFPQPSRFFFFYQVGQLHVHTNKYLYLRLSKLATLENNIFFQGLRQLFAVEHFEMHLNTIFLACLNQQRCRRRSAPLRQN